MENEPLIFHVTSVQEWENCLKESHYFPAAFLKEGFIHCCKRSQLSGVLDRYFRGKNELLVLHLNADKLKNAIRYEASAGGAFFPHIYGRIPKPAVVKVENIENSSIT